MNEPGGNFAASPSGLWHGGIHVSAEGAGPMLDLKYGVRCLADGEVIAYRLDRISPTSRIPASGGQPELNVPYSTSFALVRHTLEYPAGNRLSFFSLYMHLQGFADYECEPSQPRPGYWSTQVEVTSYAQDRPHPASTGRPSAPDHAGLRVRTSRQHGTIRCTLPHGARATIGRRDGDWGQVSAVEGPSPYPPQDGRFVGPYEAVGGWIFMGSEPGDPVVREVMPDSAFDRVVIPPHPVKVGAGDLIGYLGPYWHTADPAQPNRIVHIEVFCDGTLPAYIEASRAAAEADYHSERPILRIDRSVKLHTGPSVRQEGANAPRTAIVQVYSQAVLDALPADCKGSVDDDPFNHGKGEPWWKITSADSRYADITGWVRNRQTPAGRVTRESPGHWSDFEMFTDSDANNPTLFGSADAWLDYVLDAGKPDLSDVGKLKPLATGVYRAMSPARNEKEAADELLSHGANRWLRFRASRLIPRHRSEWASEESYRELFAQLVTRSEPSPYHAAEIERISKLAWWDEVQGKVSQPFPSSPDVFHIHPIGLVGNFFQTGAGLTIEEARVRAFLRMIRVGEGTETPAGYERLFGGQSFIKDYGRDFSDHPRILITRTNSKGKTLRSSAAGAYQIMGYNWGDPAYVIYRKQYGIADFTPVSQDRYCVILLKYKRHALEDIKSGKIQKAVIEDGCNLEWASLPGNDYGQGGVGMSTVNAKFFEYLSDELSGKSDLAVPIGGLDDLIK
ncbi:muramidase (phage lysozyme) [Paraburkholderia sp. BL10I2N1]|nr:muramidase (phage lysozyme) [Paraburkholderia sp. BL10I2N1]